MFLKSISFQTLAQIYHQSAFFEELEIRTIFERPKNLNVELFFPQDKVIGKNFDVMQIVRTAFSRNNRF